MTAAPSSALPGMPAAAQQSVLVGWDPVNNRFQTVQVDASGIVQTSASVSFPGAGTTLGATQDAGPSWTSAWGVSSAPVASSDMSSVTNVTDAPTSGQKIVIDDIFLTNRTTGALECTLKCETTAAILIGPIQVGANSTIQLTPRGKLKLATADKKVTATWSASGNVNVLIGFHSEA